MKKLFGIVTIIVLSFSVLAGCGKDVTNEGAENTTPPAAAPDADLTPASADTETDTEEIKAAVDLTDYPVVFCVEGSFKAWSYDITFNFGRPNLACEMYGEDAIIGTEFLGFRLIDDTHVEYFDRYIFNDDIDTSIMITSQDELYNRYYSDEVTKTSDRDEYRLIDIYTYEINGTEFIITDEETSKKLFTFQFSPDFTNFVDNRYEYTYHADF